MHHINRLFYVCLWISTLILPNTGHAAGVVPFVSCSVSTTSINFGTYWGDVALNSTGSIKVTCTGTATTQVQLDKGQNVPTGFATRKMASGINTMSYNLYTSPTYVNVWGDGTNSSFTVTGKTMIVYGKIPAGQAVQSGTYNDTVLVTVIW